MTMITKIHLLDIFMLLCMITLSNVTIVVGKCIAKERQALILVKQGLVDPRDLLSSWGHEEDKADCCRWRGVACDNHTGHVTHLNLSSINSFYYYHTHYYTTLIASNISHSLLELHNLNYLDLSFNYFGEQPIPKFIGSLRNLVHLDLSNAGFVGSIPNQLGNLSNLHSLDLFANYLSGNIPHQLGSISKLYHLDLGFNNNLEAENIDWLFHLSALTYLDMSDTDMGTSATNWVSLIQRIPSLVYLSLDGCNLISTPSSSLTNSSASISTLHLGYNQLTSSIFDWLFNLSSSLVHLDLSGNNLTGRIPESFGHMTVITHLDLGDNHLNGRIPESFGHMTAITHLDLRDNHLNGRIPESFAHMTAITHLDLSQNNLEGVIPKSFSNLSNLQVIDLSYNNFTGNLDDVFYVLPEDTLRDLYISGNQLTGSVPDIKRFPSLRILYASSNQLDGYLPNSFEHHSNLEQLDLWNNHLKGSIPDFTGCSSLEYLGLNANEFSGSIPDFTGCSSLSWLVLGSNQITDWETRSIGQLSNLYSLDLSRNFIHSAISEEHLSNLSNLESMNTSFNSLKFNFSSEWLPPFQLYSLSTTSCNLGPKFPNWIRNQTGISILEFSDTQISDTVPTWFWNISGTIDQLDLSSNNIRGKFSSKLFNIPEIDLSSNYFEGAIPPLPSRCSKINLSKNNFSGTLSSLFVVGARNVSFLDLSHNLLFGALPDSWVNFQALIFLNLAYNNFSGSIPLSMGHLVSLQTLILRNNNFSGELPASLRNCSNLGFVDLGLNNLSGKIPAWIGEDLPQLYALILRSNNFYGDMPHHLCHLSDLHFLDLSVNKISGTLPPCLGKLTAMIQNGNETTEHYYNSTSGALPPTSSYVDDAVARWKGQVFEYRKNFAYLNMIDLSANELTGEIPVGITRLLNLNGLNLSMNKFYGKVPAEIGQMRKLETIDLSMNNFSGEIPLSMSGLSFLSYLDLSNNNFSGRIPSGTQLQGFNASIYEGNTGLCGLPLTKICPGDETTNKVQPSSDGNEDEEEIEYKRWLYISATLGFSSTFWGLCGTLLFHRRWRHAYFLFLVNLKDQVFVITAVYINRLRN